MTKRLRLTCDNVEIAIFVLVLFVHGMLGTEFDLERGALNCLILFGESNVAVSMQRGYMLRKE